MLHPNAAFRHTTDRKGRLKKLAARSKYGNLDISFDQFSRDSQLNAAPHAPCYIHILYVVPVLIGCCMVRVTRWCAGWRVTVL